MNPITKNINLLAPLVATMFVATMFVATMFAFPLGFGLRFAVHLSAVSPSATELDLGNNCENFTLKIATSGFV